MPIILLVPMLALMVARDEQGGCFDRVPAAIPAPNSQFDGRHQTIGIHEQPIFLFRNGTSAHLRMIESPVQNEEEPLTFDLAPTGETVVAEGVRFERYSSPNLPLGRCFAFHESPDGVRRYFRSAIYGTNSLCVTKRGAAALSEPNEPQVVVSAEAPTFGTPSSGSNGDRLDVAEPMCGDPMTTGSGNITVTIAGLTATPSAILVELLDDGSVVQSRELLIHDRMVETQRPLTINFRSNTVSGMQIRATHRLLGGSTGDPVVVDVTMPASCHHLPGASLLLLLGLGALRRRRQLA
jgi:hypothetical protein